MCADNLLAQKMRRMEKTGEKVFCAYITLGYPNVQTTKHLIQAFEREGVDIVELGFPFSDPLADGPTIQYASEQALKKGVSIAEAFRLVKNLRSEGSRVPIIFFSYLNPIFHYGLTAFSKDAKKAGFDGVIIPDMPPEEEKAFLKTCEKEKLSVVLLVAPTTVKEREAELARKSKGFIYYVSVRGVTGARQMLPGEIRAAVSSLKKKVKKPVLIGFGVSTPEQGKAFSAMSNGVIVGSAIIDHLRRAKGKTEPVIRYIRSMVKSVKEKSR